MDIAMRCATPHRDRRSTSAQLARQGKRPLAGAHRFDPNHQLKGRTMASDDAAERSTHAEARRHGRERDRFRGLTAIAILATSFAALLPCGIGHAQTLPQDHAGKTSQPIYDKDGNGPKSAYWERWLPSDNYGVSSCEMPKPTDLVDRYLGGLKCVTIGKRDDSYIVFNASERLRSEVTQHNALSVSSSTDKAGEPQGQKNALAHSGDQREAWMTHSELGADLHLTNFFRAYGQIDNATQSGRNIVRPGPSASNRNDLSLKDLFAEGKFAVNGTVLDNPWLHNTIFGLRFGRENTGFGSDGFWFSPNRGTNLAGPSFDGIHAYADQGSTRLDLFAYHYVYNINSQPQGGAGVFLDRDTSHEQIWGAHLSHDFQPAQLFGREAKISVDSWYYGYMNAAARYTNRAFLKNPQSLAIVPGGTSFVAAHDYRHSFGLRVYGSIGNFSFDYSGVVQRGSFGSYDVDAWAFHTSTGYSFHRLPWSPWLGLEIDGASGGVSDGSKGGSNTIATFQPMQQEASAISTVAVAQGFSNVVDVSPRIAFHPDFHLGSAQIRGLALELWNSFYFRQNGNDAIYPGSYFGHETPPGANSYQITAIKRGQFIGYQPDLRLTWHCTPHLTYGLDLAYEFVGPALKVAGGRDTFYMKNQLIFSF